MAIEKKMWGDDTKEVKPEEDRVNTGYKAVDDPNKHVTKAEEGRDNPGYKAEDNPNKDVTKAEEDTFSVADLCDFPCLNNVPM